MDPANFQFIFGWPFWLSVAVACYLGGTPLIVLLTLRMESFPTLQVVGSDVPLPIDVERQFRHVQESLAACGFEEVETLFLPQTVSNVATILRLFVNREAQHSAMAVAMYSTHPIWKIQAQYVEFNTRFRDNSEFNTGNPNDVTAFPRPPQTLTIHVPWIQNTQHLYAIHEGVVALKAPSAERELRLDTKFAGDASAFVANCMREECEAARANGYLRIKEPKVTVISGSDESNPYQSPLVDIHVIHYRPTVKGAYLMTWKQLWPFKWFVVRRRHRQARDMLMQIGMT